MLELRPGGSAPATRYLIGVVADGELVWAVLDAAFREFGLPKRYAPRLADASSACLVQPLKFSAKSLLGPSVRRQRVVRPLSADRDQRPFRAGTRSGTERRRLRS